MFKPIEIFDLVDREYQYQIYKYLTDIKFPWHYVDDATFEVSNDPQTSTPGFVNLIYHNNNESNPHLEFFQPLLAATLEKTGFTLTNLLRIRAGFLLNTKYVIPSMPYKYNSPHRDFDQEHYTAVYYVNKSDGDTVIFKEIEASEKYNVLHKSTPDQGKLVLFNGWHYHASTCPKMFTKRIAITMNFTAVKNG